MSLDPSYPWQPSIDDQPSGMTVASFGLRMISKRCGHLGAEVHPPSQKHQPTESLTGKQWRGPGS
jgi:hypothetical protein